MMVSARGIRMGNVAVWLALYDPPTIACGNVGVRTMKLVFRTFRRSQKKWNWSM